MPVYPCVRCDQLVDTHSDPFCRNCGEKHPFQCSRCSKQINQVDIFQLERLKTKKPLLCCSCGEQMEVVECGICKKTLVRSQGRQVSQGPGAKVYHTDCYDKQMHTVGVLRRLTPVFALVGVLIGYFLGGSVSMNNTIVALVMAGVCGFVLFGMARMGQSILIPK